MYNDVKYDIGSEVSEARETEMSTWMGRATAHFDTPKIRKEASDIWEKANKSNAKR